jgi:phage terminase small subunit
MDIDTELPYMGLQVGSLTVQQEKLVLGITRGMTIAAAGRAAGYASPSTASQACKLPAAARAIEYYREQMREEVKFEIAHAHSMYLDAFNASANATEMKNTTDSLVKLHGLAKEQSGIEVNLNINGMKQLERLSDEELLKIAGHDITHLSPQADSNV